MAPFNVTGVWVSGASCKDWQWLSENGNGWFRKNITKIRIMIYCFFSILKGRNFESLNNNLRHTALDFIPPSILKIWLDFWSTFTLIFIKILLIITQDSRTLFKIQYFNAKFQAKCIPSNFQTWLMYSRHSKNHHKNTINAICRLSFTFRVWIYVLKCFP